MKCPRHLMSLWPVLALSACATSGSLGSDLPSGPVTLEVNAQSRARDVLVAVPAGSALERFESRGADGHLLSYIAFTETDTGGLVFVDQKLLGSVSRPVAQAFYSCRGYATARGAPWVEHADEWLQGLRALARPVTQVSLTFSGRSTTQSIQQLVDNPAISQINALISMGTNPLSIFRRLRDANNTEHERQRYEREKAAMLTLSPGSTEAQVAAAAQLQEVGFLPDGLIMAYPTHLVEFYVQQHVVRTIQQPSFYHLAQVRPAAFYTPGMAWAQCTPATWQNAMNTSSPP
jgi:hypothetical protein